MEWLLLALVAGGGGGWGARKWRERKALRRTQAEELEGVRRLAEEDITLLGEQLRRLDSRDRGRIRSTTRLTGRLPDRAGRLRVRAANGETDHRPPTRSAR